MRLTIVAAFEEFLTTYKSTSVETTDAFSRLNLEDDDLDAEYDFLDESGDEAAAARRANTKVKYMRMLQHVADRTSNQVVIDLEDLTAVSLCRMSNTD
jgi:DNA replication licensing factor MCM7